MVHIHALYNVDIDTTLTCTGSKPNDDAVLIVLDTMSPQAIASAVQLRQ